MSRIIALDGNVKTEEPTVMLILQILTCFIVSGFFSSLLSDA